MIVTRIKLLREAFVVYIFSTPIQTLDIQYKISDGLLNDQRDVNLSPLLNLFNLYPFEEVVPAI